MVKKVEIYNFLDKTLLNKFCFRMINMLVCLIYFMPSTMNIANIPTKICFIWGGVIAINELFIKRSVFKMKYGVLLFIVLVSFAITSILNRDFGIIRNIYNLGYLAISCLVFYPVETDYELEIENFIKLINLFIFVVLIAGFISILQFCFIISYHVPTGTPGLMARQGFMESRLFGVYTSPNVGALFGFVSVICSMLIVSQGKKRSKSYNAFLIINGIIQLLYYILSSSRGVQITIYAFLLSVFFLMVVSKNYRNRLLDFFKLSLKKFIVVAVLVLLFFSVGVDFSKTVLGYVPLVLNSSRHIEKVEDNKEDTSKVTIEHSESDAEVSSGRFTIWKAAITVWKNRPMFGYGDINFYHDSPKDNALSTLSLTDLDRHELKRSHGNMHNGYLQVLLSSGIIGFILIYLFYGLSFFYIFKNFLTRNDSQILTAGLMLAFLVSVFANELVEAHILFNKRDVISQIFWFVLGLLMIQTSKYSKIRKSESK
ncbi:O-antigen ligase family protein [Enterococcus raffinosus]|uniref:O-antigen ligase family protein n=1 Tax=Enterococcus raffinosus TaxID=71452 RepID=UPI00288DA55E|nr:O-antigen ligase family protein [Enterococcus raffinosus]MDT2573624.1 O-antigen ligase family protein [Enterococcus raffinosus]